MELVTSPTGAAPQQNPEDPAVALTAFLKKVRGAVYPAPGSKPQLICDYVDKLWKEQESDALARYKNATQNILYFNNRQWIAWNKADKAWKDLPNPDESPRVVINYIEPILHSRVTRLVSGTLSWRVVPDSNSYEQRDHCEVARNWLEAMWERTELEYKVPRSLLMSFCTGVTAIKSFWNKDIGPSEPATKFFPQPPIPPQPIQGENGEVVGMSDPQSQPDVQLPVDENGQPVNSPEEAFQIRQGDTDIALRSIFNVRLNPEAQGWTRAEGLRWLIDTEVLPISVARAMFPDIAEKIQPQQGAESSLTYERIASGVVRASNTTNSNPYVGKLNGGAVQDMTVIREYWELPEEGLFPEGRLVVTVGGNVAYDGAFPDGVFPYDPLFDTPGTLSAYGRPSVNTMRPPQDVINRQWSSIVSEMEADGTGRYVAWQIPGVPDQINSSSNRVTQIPMRSVLANRPIGDVFKRLEPGQVSPDRWRLIDQAKVALFDVGAYHEVTRGQIPPGLDSGVAIQALLESEAGQLKPAVDALKRSLVSVARKQLKIAKSHYAEDVERWIPVERPDLGYMVQGMTGIDLPDPERIKIDLENFRPQSEAANRAEIKDLMKLQVIDARQGLKMMDLGRGLDGAFESQTRQYARARMENLAFERGDFALITGPSGIPEFVYPEDGSPFLLPDCDDHAVHVDVHYEILLDNSKPWAMRQAVLEHVALHKQVAAQAMAAQAAAEVHAQGALAQATASKPTESGS